MKGYVDRVIRMCNALEAALGYTDEYDEYGVMPHQLLALRCSSHTVRCFDDVRTIGSSKSNLKDLYKRVANIDPELLECCESLIDQAEEEDYTPISIFNEDYLNLWQYGVKCDPILVFAKGDLSILSHKTNRLGILGDTKNDSLLGNEKNYLLLRSCNPKLTPAFTFVQDLSQHSSFDGLFYEQYLSNHDKYIAVIPELFAPEYEEVIDEVCSEGGLVLVINTPQRGPWHLNCRSVSVEAFIRGICSKVIGI